jgi:hypothetical protein
MIIIKNVIERIVTNTKKKELVEQINEALEILLVESFNEKGWYHANQRISRRNK